MRIKALCCALLLGSAATALAQDAKPPAFTFAFHGFAGASVYVQDANLGPSEGHQSLYVNNQGSAALKAPAKDKLVFGGDVRQSRFNFSVAGPKVFGGSATPKAVLEVDFFGGFTAGNYGDVSLLPRMRLAYAELDFGAHRLLAGQANDLIFTMAPTSLAHIAFPFGYAAGNIGWRRPALWGFHTFGDPKKAKLEFAWEIGRSQWTDSGQVNQPSCAAGAACAPNSTGNGIGQNTVGSGGDKYGFSLGEASGLPAIEGRVMFTYGNWLTLFTTGHWQSIDRTGVDAFSPTSGTNSDLQTIAMNVGGKLVYGPLTLAATGFTGKNLAPLLGSFLQFNPTTFGDIHEYGGWVQAGFNLTKEFSIWGFAGTDKPNQKEAVKANFNKIQNVTTAGLVQYRDGGYAVGLEWIHFHTKTRNTASPRVASLDASLDGNQVIATAMYFF